MDALTDLTFRLEEERLDRRAVVLTAHGELDMATTPALRDRMRDAMAAGVRGIVLDLRPTGFLDSIAVAAMLQARRQLGDHGRLAIIVEHDSYTRLVLEIAGLPQCLDVVQTRAAALAAIGAA